ncbi:MAG TPA: hypothetical protein VF550_16830 [Polyangia bacterium]
MRKRARGSIDNPASRLVLSPSLRKGLPVFMSHGRSDNILPFDLAERLRAELVAAGLAVTFTPFDGSHEIPGEVVVALGEFLASIKP